VPRDPFHHVTDLVCEYRQMRAEKGDRTLQTTALLNEAWLRLVDVTSVSGQDRAHFFGIRANHAARPGRAFSRPPHRQAGWRRDEPLKALAEVDDRKARVIDVRLFGGLSVTETAYDVSPEACLLHELSC